MSLLEQIEKKDKEVEALTKLVNMLTSENDKYSSRINRAIKYLEDDTIKYPTAKEWREHLIKILKGDE